MIFVDRSQVAIPEILLSTRARAAREKIHGLLTTASEQHLAQLRFTFDSSIYLRTKSDLLKLFHGKCSYCESRVDTTGGADLEHFRPKQGAETLDGEREQHYYAWLAYEWDNLLIACPSCNRRTTSARIGKANRFPVEGPRAPVLTDVATCRAVEMPLLLDPCFDDPAEHLAFSSDGRCRPLTKRGEATILMLGLNVRERLVLDRRAAWMGAIASAKAFLDARSSGHNDVADELLTELEKLVSGERPYTAATRSALKEFWDGSRHNTGIDVEPPWEKRGTALAVDQDALGKAVQAATRDAEALPPAPPPIEPALPPPPEQYPGREPLPPFAHKRVRRLAIRNFRVIEEIDLEVPDGPGGEDDPAGALMLLGENSTGKSTILNAVALALLGTAGIASLGLRGVDFFNRGTDWGMPGADDLPTEVTIHFDDDSVRQLLIDPVTQELQSADSPAVVLLGYGPRRFFIDRHGVPRSPAPGARVATLFDPIAVIANPSDWLMTCSDQSYAAAIRALRQILALPDEDFLDRPPKDQRDTGRILFELQGSAVPLERLSEGYKTLVAMGIDIIQEMLRYWPDLETARGVVLIDEVETHLHPRWKMRIVQRLRRAMPQVQFIVTTHEPLCLRGIYNGEVQVLRRDMQTSRIERVTGLPNVQGLTVEQLLTSDLFGLFSAEDPKVEEELIRYVALAAKRDRTPDEEAELEQQRVSSAARLRLGATPAAALVQDAASAYVQTRREAPQEEKAAVRREAIERVVALWSSLPGNEGS